MVNFITAVILILFAVFSRLMPHPMNFVPIAAIALFSGAYLNKKYAMLIPIAAMLISDAFIGFYSYMAWVYGSFILIAFVGFWLKKRFDGAGAGKKTGYIAATTIVSSVLFFIITNFGVWTSGMYYDMSVSGLIQCYTMAIPFFRNSLAADVIYAAVMFTVYELIVKYVKNPQLQESRIRK